MLELRKAADRGHANHGWLDTWHTFSFDTYYDPGHMGYRALRVINDDRVAAGHGFPTHPHRDMEIITIVWEGALGHKDSTGGGSVLKPGEVQRMTAGRGIRHSEFNASEKDELHLNQIWILPEKQGLDPGYEQKDFSDRLRQGEMVLVAAPQGGNGAMTIHQDARIYVGWLPEGKKSAIELGPGRHAWVQVGTGAPKVNGQQLQAGDGVAVSDEKRLEVTGPGQVIVFDLA